MLLYFWLGCIPFRTLLAIIAKTLKPEKLKILGYIALIPAFGLLFNFITGTRMHAPESSTGLTWWNSFRPIHAIMYLGFAYAAIRKKSFAWIFLIIDVIFAIMIAIYHDNFTFTI